MSKTYHEAFNIVTARAFADMKLAITAGRPFLKTGGFIVLSKGPKETLNMQDLGENTMILQKREEFLLPYSDYRRALWVFKKPAVDIVTK